MNWFDKEEYDKEQECPSCTDTVSIVYYDKQIGFHRRCSNCGMLFIEDEEPIRGQLSKKQSRGL